MHRSRSARRASAVCITLFVSLLVTVSASACTNLLVSPTASVDGSTFVTYSCDGGVFAAIQMTESAVYPVGATSRLINDTWYVTEDFAPGVLGSIPQATTTHRYLDLLAGPDYFHIGGMNEHGVCIAETTIVDTRPELSNPNGWMAPFSGQAERSLMTLALQRAKTAREAVLLIGALAEAYGYRSTFPIEGEQFAIGDGTEVWSMEIFGPGPNWTQGSSRPGAVWCAQRVPEGEVAVSANRSRIGQIAIDEPSHFLASQNVFTLAEEMGWWDSESGDPFVWNQVYAPSDRWTSIIREWRALDLVAPSLGLEPSALQLPFSVRPDTPQSVIEVIAIQRDLLQGTDYDVTENPEFMAHGEKSPLACPACPHELYSLLNLEPARTIANARTSATCVYQTHVTAPESLRGCTWFGFGNAATTCYIPIYSGVSEIPAEWSNTDLASFDTGSPFWALTLPGKLAAIQWQDAYPVIQAVRDPAERTFIREQQTLREMVEMRDSGTTGITVMLNEYTLKRLDAVRLAFADLHDYLVSQFFSGAPRWLNVTPPVIQIPRLDVITGN